MSFEDLLIHTCQIGTKASSQNTLGEYTYTWTYSSDNTICRWFPMTAEERIVEQGRFGDVRYRVSFASGSSVSTNNRLRYGSKDYRVREALFDSSYHHLTCLVSEVS